MFDKTQTTLISYPCAKIGESYTVPSTVTRIENNSCCYCKNLTSVTIPSSVINIGKAAFMGCTKLKSISVDDNNPNYCSLDGVLFNKDKTTLVSYPNAKGSTYTIPLSVTSIRFHAFQECRNLKSIEIPSSVTSIERYAFFYCTSLTSITISNPDCEIYDSSETIYYKATIYGYNGSTAQTYATKYERKFVAIYDETEITFDQTGGSGGTESTTAEYGSCMPEITVPSKTGYTFNGYYDAESGGTQYYNADGSSAATWDKRYDESITLYAQWTANTYTIKFNGNGNTNDVTMSDLSMTYDVEKALTENAYEKTGYNFIGWSTTSNGAVEYNDKATVKNLTSTNGDIITLYAQWEIKVLSLSYAHKLYSFDSGSGTITDLDKTPTINIVLPTSVNYGEKIDLTGKETTYDKKTIYRAPTCDGYIFCGWYLDAELTNPAFSGNSGTVEITDNTTLYAKWISVGEMKLSEDDKYIRNDEVYKEVGGFEMYGVQIRMKAEGDMGRGMRFVTRIRANLLNEIRKATGHDEKKPTNQNYDSFEPYDDNASYGYMMKAQEIFSNESKCNSDPLQMVEVAANINNGRYADFENYFLFTGVITNIKEDKFDANFSATAYIKYIDANGVERRYCYTEPRVDDGAGLEYNGVYHTTLRKAANAYLNSPINFTNAQLAYLHSIVD